MTQHADAHVSAFPAVGTKVAKAVFAYTVWAAVLRIAVANGKLVHADHGGAVNIINVGRGLQRLKVGTAACGRANIWLLHLIVPLHFSARCVESDKTSLLHEEKSTEWPGT